MNNDINDIELICYVYEIENRREKKQFIHSTFFFCTKTNAVSFMNFCLEICNCFIMKLNDSVANFGKFMISCEIC